MGMKDPKSFIPIAKEKKKKNYRTNGGGGGGDVWERARAASVA